MLAQHSVLKDLVIATVEVTAAAWIQLLAWELPYVVGAAIKKKKKEPRVPAVAQWVRNLILSSETMVQSLA